MSTMPREAVPVRNATCSASVQIFASSCETRELVIAVNCESGAVAAAAVPATTASRVQRLRMVGWWWRGCRIGSSPAYRRDRVPAVRWLLCGRRSTLRSMARQTHAKAARRYCPKLVRRSWSSTGRVAASGQPPTSACDWQRLAAALAEARAGGVRGAARAGGRRREMRTALVAEARVGGVARAARGAGLRAGHALAQAAGDGARDGAHGAGRVRGQVVGGLGRDRRGLARHVARDRAEVAELQQ